MNLLTSLPARRLRLAMFIAGAALAASAQAGTLDIVGGFTSYSGPLETTRAIGYQSMFQVAGQASPIVGTPTEAIPGFDYAWAHGIGQGTIALTSPGTYASAVDFYRDRAFDPPLHNVIAFTPSSGQETVVGQTIKLGTLSFTNGAWLGDLPDSSFAFTLQTVSATAALNGHVFNGVIDFHVTTGCTPDYSSCSSDPVANADYFHIRALPGSGSTAVEMGYVGVYEADILPPGGSNGGSIDLYGRIGSLIPTALLNAQGVTLQSAIPVVGAPAPAPVPEPSTALLTLAGLGLMALRIRRMGGAP